MCGVAVRVQHGHGDLMVVKHGKKAAKQVGMIDREMTVRPVLNRLVLNHRAEHFACFREVHRCRCIRFVEEKEAMNGQRSVNFGVRDRSASRVDWSEFMSPSTPSVATLR